MTAKELNAIYFCGGGFLWVLGWLMLIAVTDSDPVALSATFIANGYCAMTFATNNWRNGAP